MVVCKCMLSDKGVYCLKALAVYRYTYSQLHTHIHTYSCTYTCVYTFVGTNICIGAYMCIMCVHVSLQKETSNVTISNKLNASKKTN